MANPAGDNQGATTARHCRIILRHDMADYSTRKRRQRGWRRFADRQDRCFAWPRGQLSEVQEIDCVVLIGDAGGYVCASLWPSGALRSERVGYAQLAIDHEPVLDVVWREHIAIDVAQRPMKTEPSGVTSTSIVAGSR